MKQKICDNVSTCFIPCVKFTAVLFHEFTAVLFHEFAAVLFHEFTTVLFHEFAAVLFHEFTAALPAATCNFIYMMYAINGTICKQSYT